MKRACLRSRLSWIVAVMIALSTVIVTLAPAHAVSDGYYKSAHRDDIYKVEGGSVRPISFDEWASAGFPAPLPAPTGYVKYAWSPTIYGVTTWFSDESSWQWDSLSFAQWQRARFPAPSNAGWIAGSHYHKWGTSDELFVVGEDGVTHKLTYDEWAASGFRPFEVRANEGYARLSWSANVARMTDLAAGLGSPIDYPEWRRQDFPRPALYVRFPGDQFNLYYGDPTIYYSGPTMSRAITYAEWSAAGFPHPNRPLPSSPRQCSDFASQSQAQDWFDFYFSQHGDWAGLDGNGDGRACAELPTAYGQFCTDGRPIRSVQTNQNLVAFTFDDGPWPSHTRNIMTRFEAYGWRASFFMIGQNIRNHPEIAREVVQRGHLVANHSMTHQYSPSIIAAEVAPTRQLIRDVTGVWTTYFRSPGLTPSSDIDQAVFRAGSCNISTDVNLGDWVSPRASASTLCSRFKNALHPGMIVLLHDGGSHQPTVDAVPCMLEHVRAMGYTVVSLADLLARGTPQRASALNTEATVTVTE